MSSLSSSWQTLLSPDLFPDSEVRSSTGILTFVVDLLNILESALEIGKAFLPDDALSQVWQSIEALDSVPTGILSPHERNNVLAQIGRITPVSSVNSGSEAEPILSIENSEISRAQEIFENVRVSDEHGTVMSNLRWSSLETFFKHGYRILLITRSTFKDSETNSNLNTSIAEQSLLRTYDSTLEMFGHAICDSLRAIPEAERVLSLADIENHAGILFPRLNFSLTAWRHASKLKRHGVKKVVMHLDVLSWHVPRIWETYPDQVRRIKELSALGIDASSENSNRHKDKKAAKRLRYRFNEGVQTCEWHTKFTYDDGRIYFHFTPQNHKVFVGELTSHS